MITRFKGTSYRWNTLSVALLVLLVVVGLTNANNISRAAEPLEAEPPPERTLIFPDDAVWLRTTSGGSPRWARSTRIKIRDWDPGNYRYDTGLSAWHDHGEALGVVTIPAGKELALSVLGNPWGNLSPLADLPPDTFQYIQLWKRFSDDVTQWITRADLRMLAGQRSLKSLEFLDRPLSDDLLAELPAMTNLRELSLEGSQITDAGLVHVAAMPWLEFLNLNGTKVTDAGMAYLEDMTALKSLSLDRTDLSDTGLARLSGLTSLEALSMSNTRVSDDGLIHLQDLQALRELQVTNTYVTAEGLDLLPNIVPSQTEAFVRSQVRLGMILSHYQATGPSSVGRPYSYSNQKRLLQILVDCGFDIYAIIDPGSRELGELPGILESAGIEDVVIENTDRIALQGLDVIVSGLDYNIRLDAATVLDDVIRGGVGFINFSVLGINNPGIRNEIIQDLIGIKDGRYGLYFEERSSEVLKDHPILGPLKAGDPFTLRWLDGVAGTVDGTPLLSTPAGVREGYVPLYVRQLGQGRIVTLQWIRTMDQSSDFTAEDFLTRCVLWAAKFPLD